jgi:hypothetical protein
LQRNAIRNNDPDSHAFPTNQYKPSQQHFA